MRDPVCPLKLALYGHPDSGGFWEQHCDEHLRHIGFVPVEEWKSCYIHEKLGLLLVVYVDDFNFAGPKANLAKGWKLIRDKLILDDPTPLGRFLGCEHTHVQKVLASSGASVNALEYCMTEFMLSW